MSISKNLITDREQAIQWYEANKLYILSIKLLEIDFWVNDLRNPTEDREWKLSFRDVARHEALSY